MLITIKIIKFNINFIILNSFFATIFLSEKVPDGLTTMIADNDPLTIYFPDQQCIGAPYVAHRALQFPFANNKVIFGR